MVQCENTSKKVSFEWSHLKIPSPAEKFEQPCTA